MRSKSFSRFLRERSEVSVTTSLMPDAKCRLAMDGIDYVGRKKKKEKLTRILGILRTHILVTGIEDIFVHQRSTRSNLAEKADFDWLSDLHALTLLDKDLPCILASIFTVQTGHAILLWVVAFFEWL